MRTSSQKETQVDAKSSNVCSSFAIEPDNAQVALAVELEQLAGVDGAHSKSFLHSRDQRRSLEESSRKSLNSLGKLCLSGVGMKADD